MTLATQSICPPRSRADEIRHRDRLDASILRAFGERRALRSIRITQPSLYWDRLEQVVTSASTLLWEMSSSSVQMDICDDLLAFLAFLARELEVTEGLDLEPKAECSRLAELAPRAIEALDTIANGVSLTGSIPSVSASGAPKSFFTHALAQIIRSLRAELTFARDVPCAFKIAA